jgi:hypothetical protein
MFKGEPQNRRISNSRISKGEVAALHLFSKIDRIHSFDILDSKFDIRYSFINQNPQPLTLNLGTL